MMSKAGLGIGVVFALMGIGVGMLVLYLASRQASLEGASNRLLFIVAAVYCGPALVVSMGGAFLAARSLDIEHAGYIALLGGVLTVVVPIVTLVATSSIDQMRLRARQDFEQARRTLFESVAEVDALHVERSGRVLTIRTKLRSRRAFDLRAEVSVLAYGPGWSGYVEPCSSTQDFTLVPSQEHIVSAGCEQSWLEIDDAHLEVRVRVQERRNDERIHLASRTLRVPGLCPAPR